MYDFSSVVVSSRRGNRFFDFAATGGGTRCIIIAVYVPGSMFRHVHAADGDPVNRRTGVRVERVCVCVRALGWNKKKTV